MRRQLLRSFAALLPFLLATGCVHAAPQTKAPAAFSTPGRIGEPPATLKERGVRRVRPVEINLNLFDRSKALPLHIEMNFFPDVNISVQWDRVETVNQPSGFMWTGSVSGTPGGHAAIVISGSTVSGNISRGDGWIYEIRTTEDGRRWVREINQRDFPEESQPVVK